MNKKKLFKSTIAVLMSCLLLVLTPLSCFAMTPEEATSFNDSWWKLREAKKGTQYVIGTKYGGYSYSGSQKLFYYDYAEAGAYNIYTTGNTDTYGALYTGNNGLFSYLGVNQTASDDDSGRGTNFCMKCDLYPSYDYWVAVRGYSYVSGGYNVIIEPNLDTSYLPFVLDEETYEETGEEAGYLCGAIWKRTSPYHCCCAYPGRDSQAIVYITAEELNYLYKLLEHGYLDYMCDYFDIEDDTEKLAKDIVDAVCLISDIIELVVIEVNVWVAIISWGIKSMISSYTDNTAKKYTKLLNDIRNCGGAELNLESGDYEFKYGVKLDFSNHHYYICSDDASSYKVDHEIIVSSMGYTYMGYKLYGEKGARGTWESTYSGISFEIIRNLICQ